MIYPIEPLTDTEAARLAPHVTSLTSPVFALTNLPETVKGAMFARYSRYRGTLRRLFIDEFAGSLPAVAGGADDSEGAAAAGVYDRVFVGFGDDSVAQLGGVHVACEWSSNILTKLLQRPRIGSYLEQSTRYIAFDKPINDHGHFRHYRGGAGDDTLADPVYLQAMDDLFGAYSRLLPRMETWAAGTFPHTDGPEAAWRRAIKAKALDALRGLLPASTLSHMGIYASGQTYEQLVLHLLAHPLPEARHYGEMLLDALKHVIPSFLARVERQDRGGVWIDYLDERRRAGERWASKLCLTRDADADQGPSVKLLRHDGTEDDLLAALLYEQVGVSESDTVELVKAMGEQEKAAAIADLVGDRENRRHRPGRGFETLRYRFEVVSDYGAFRDLQRHRMLTVQWQTLAPDLGAEVPADVDAAGCGDEFRAALDISRRAYEHLLERSGPHAASYALCLAYRIRYVLDLNAREAMHLCELRSGKDGHPSYRAVAQEMYRQIAGVHPQVGAAMSHMDLSSDPRLERIASEIRNERKAQAAERA